VPTYSLHHLDHQCAKSRTVLVTHSSSRIFELDPSFLAILVLLLHARLVLIRSSQVEDDRHTLTRA
jgi:hypothetical protein